MAVRNQGVVDTILEELGEGFLEMVGVRGRGEVAGERAVERYEEAATGVTPPDLEEAREKQEAGQEKVQDIAEWRRMAIEQLGPAGAPADILTKALGFPLRPLLPEIADVALGKKPTGAGPTSLGRGELYELDPVRSPQEAAAAIQRASFTTPGEQNSYITEIEQLDKVRSFNTLKPLISKALGITQRELDRFGPDRLEEAVKWRNQQYQKNQDSRAAQARTEAAIRHGDYMDLREDVVEEVPVMVGTDPKTGYRLYNNKQKLGSGEVKWRYEKPYTVYQGSQAQGPVLGIDLMGNEVMMNPKEAAELAQAGGDEIYQARAARERASQNEVELAKYRRMLMAQRNFDSVAHNLASRLEEGGTFIGTLEGMVSNVASAYTQYKDFTDSVFGSYTPPEGSEEDPEYKRAPSESQFKQNLLDNAYPFLSYGAGGRLRQDLIESAGLRASIYKIALLHARTNTESDRPVSEAAFNRTVNGLGLNSGDRMRMAAFVRQAIQDGARTVNTMRESLIGVHPLVTEDTFMPIEMYTRDPNLRQKMYPYLPPEELYDPKKWKAVWIYDKDGKPIKRRFIQIDQNEAAKERE